MKRWRIGATPDPSDRHFGHAAVFDALGRLSVPEMTLHRHHPERQLLIGIQSIIRCGYVRITF
jgi:hypothetical protein